MRSRAPTNVALGLLALAHFIVSVDFNIVYIALPQIGRELGFSTSSLQWVVSAYALGFGGFLLLGGRMADRIGARRIFMAGAGVFGLASVAGALAAASGELVAARAGQGIGAAMLFPATLALVNTRFAAGAERRRALAVWGVAGAFGALAGGAAGGVLTSTFGWTSVFVVMVPLATLAVVAAPRVLTADHPPDWSAGGFDLPGALTATAASLLVVFGLVSGADAGWTSWSTTASLAAGAALFALFALVEHRVSDPLMPLRMFRNRSLVAAMTLIFVLMGPVTGLHYLYTTYLQDVLGRDALEAGLGFLPQSVLAMAGSWFLLPRLLSRWDMRSTLTAGSLGIAVSIAVIVANMSPDGTYWELLPGLALFGLFAGTAYPAVFAAAGEHVPGERQGVATAMVSTAQQVGGAMGLAVLVAVASAGLDPASGPATGDELAGLRAAGWMAVVITVVAASAVLLIRRDPQVEPVADGATDRRRPATAGRWCGATRWCGAPRRLAQRCQRDTSSILTAD